MLSWLARRESESVYHRLLKELSLEDHDTLKSWTRLDKDQYHRLLELVTPLIAKSDIKMRKAVTAGERLTLTLRYLATGESLVSLAYQFRISHNLISSIIPSVCRAIYQVLQPQYLHLPRNQSEWQHVASQYYARWNFPMCIGALDGKRILISKPPRSGSEYYDYKGHFSLIMMALVDADYKFMYVDVGASGRASDAGVWERCGLRDAIEEKKKIPPSTPIPFTRRQCPFVIVGEDAFPLKTYLMKPYPGKDLPNEKLVFNYLLHNYLRVNSGKKHAASHNTHGEHRHEEVEDVLQETFQRLLPIGRGHSNDAKVVRETFEEYFNNEGSVPWQAERMLMH
ncbi:protein ALP1-like [Portunus trituberculatus]|nr:protein ALP1-like [Portunus trituberculatus]